MTKKTRLVVKNRRRFLTFLTCITVLLFIGIFGLLLPSSIHADCSPPPKTVTVVRGDTLWSIASEQLGGSGDIRTMMDKIIAQNSLGSKDLAIGQTLVMPAD